MNQALFERCQIGTYILCSQAHMCFAVEALNHFELQLKLLFIYVIPLKKPFYVSFSLRLEFKQYTPKYNFKKMVIKDLKKKKLNAFDGHQEQ